MTDAVIAVFTKMPRAGRVKTRLVPPLTDEQAAAVHAASLRDVIARAREVHTDVRIVFDDEPGADAYFAEAFPGLERRPQSTGDLGQRLERGLDDLFAAGSSAAIVLGADSPTLPPDRLRRALAAVKAGGVVLGPSADGGYYLIAIRRTAWPTAAALFHDVPWSTEQVWETTLRRASVAGIGITPLDPWYDIDRWEDLQRAAGDAEAESHLAKLLTLQNMIEVCPTSRGFTGR